MYSYEEVLEIIVATPLSPEGQDRTIRWFTQAEVVGAARNNLGHIELFLSGPELLPKTKSLRSAIHHHSWTRENGRPLQANRLLFPPYGHYDQMAALIVTELLRERADQNLPSAFAATEPIIELAIRRLELSEAALLGLAGELLLLDALVRRADEKYVGQLVCAWDGWRRSARDLNWHSTGVEVKSTTRPSSSHAIQGTHQVEPTAGDDATAGEGRLLLVSIGLQTSTSSENAFTVPQLVQRITDRLDATNNRGQVNDFWSHVANYGAESGLGYRHPDMAEDAPFTRAFIPAFIRAYDMGDPTVQVLRRNDILPYQHVDASSISFRIDLPAMLGPGNPVSGLNQVADLILSN